jgi:hypothetical protein
MSTQNPSIWLGPTRIRALVDDWFAAHACLDSAGAYVPRVRERVRVDGHDEIFFIVYVDARHRLADVVCGERVGFLNDVPFSAIRSAGTRRTNS